MIAVGCGNETPATLGLQVVLLEQTLRDSAIERKQR